MCTKLHTNTFTMLQFYMQTNFWLKINNVNAILSHSLQTFKNVRRLQWRQSGLVEVAENCHVPSLHTTSKTAHVNKVNVNDTAAQTN